MACKVLISVSMAAAVWITVPSPAHAQNAPPAGQAAPATAPATLGRPADLLAVLAGSEAAQSQRDEAARRLVAMAIEEADNALLSALEDFRNPRGQLAAARALAEDPTPDPAHIDPLAALIGGDPTSTEAAARALAHLRDSEYARLRLLGAAANRDLPQQSRLAVLRSMAPLSDKRAAETLVGVATNPQETASVRTAAADELVEMTGLTQNGASAQLWADWWAANQGKPDGQFAQEMLAARAARLDRVEARYDRLATEVRQHLRENFQEAPAASKEKVLLGYLRSAAGEVREIGAEIIVDLFEARRTIPDSAAQQLRTMVADSDPEVRLQAAGAIRAINDKGALDAVLAQLAIERVPEVRAALAAALAPIGSPRGVEPLLALLKDPSPMVVQAAADALTSLGERLGSDDPKMASQVCRALNDALRRTGMGPEAAQLRQELAGAMVAWASPEPEVRETFRDLLRPNEPPLMRRQALQYFGRIGADFSPAADIIVNSNALQDRDRDVRATAVNALAGTAKAEHAPRLYERTLAENEPDERVREDAWLALAGLFEREFQIDQLNAWADKVRDVPQRRLTVLETLRDKLLTAGLGNELAVVRQNLGETYMQLNQPARAALEFEQALGVPRPGQVRDLLVRQLMEAHLRAGNYEKATTFGSQMIAENKQYMSTIRPALVNEVDRLRTVDPEAALRLIGLTLKMDPPLPEPVQAELRIMESQLQQAAPTAPAQPAP